MAGSWSPVRNGIRALTPLRSQAGKLLSEKPGRGKPPAHCPDSYVFKRSATITVYLTPSLSACPAGVASLGAGTSDPWREYLPDTWFQMLQAGEADLVCYRIPVPDPAKPWWIVFTNGAW